jgi:hypothetical protein
MENVGTSPAAHEKIRMRRTTITYDASNKKMLVYDILIPATEEYRLQSIDDAFLQGRAPMDLGHKFMISWMTEWTALTMP